MFKRKINKLPNYQNPIVLSRDFNEFFQQKVTRLFQRFDNSIPFFEPTCQHHWSEFSLLSQLEVERSLNHVSNSTAPHDVVPAVRLKFLINRFSDTFTELFNCVLSHGVFPSSLKQGVIVPLHKKDDENDLGNYRPVTNTLLLSKIIERHVLSQMKSYFNKNGLWPRFQSAYRQNHSTESSILYCLEKVSEIINKKKPAVVISLDMTSAFDTVNLDILLMILKNKFGFDGIVLNFFESYLKHRSSQVFIDNCLSESLISTSGVPQGSILGPLLFSLYLTPLYTLLDEMNVSYHFYADDCQLIFDYEQGRDEIDNVLQCTIGMMKKLKLVNNQNTTDIIFVSNRKSSFKPPEKLVLFGTELLIKSSVKILGIHFDRNLTLEKQFNKVCQQCYIQLHKLYAVKRFIDIKQRKELVSCFILPCLDYCNIIYTRLDMQFIQKLQKVQNSAAKFVFGLSKFSSSKSALKKLHWLPIKQRITFKLLCSMFKVDRAIAPIYLRELFERNVNSACPSRQRLFMLPNCTSEAARRCFRFQGAKEWNELPAYIRMAETLEEFKKLLKTHLFCQAFWW